MDRMQRQVAVALRYKKDNAVPQVIAKGVGPIAEEIARLATRHDIPIRRQADLAHLLGQVEIGSGIPPELFSVVAEILAFIYLVDASHSEPTG